MLPLVALGAVAAAVLLAASGGSRVDPRALQAAARAGFGSAASTAPAGYSSASGTAAPPTPVMTRAVYQSFAAPAAAAYAAPSYAAPVPTPPPFVFPGGYSTPTTYLASVVAGLRTIPIFNPAPPPPPPPPTPAPGGSVFLVP